ncbi:universal stress protein [Bradyrhizobium sp.]|uniref:universal stress protein n=1 Tax=Bradyrhizobium sp. TaxID=376 RepID=UPI004037A4FF
MSIRDALLPLIGQSSRSTMAAIEKCVAMSRGLDVRVTALAIETEDAASPAVADVLGATEIVQTAPTAHGLLAAFAAAATKLSLRNEQRLERTAGGAMIDMVVREARLRDIAIAIVRTADSISEKLVERLLFETGRPVLMCPEETADSLAASFGDVAIAWDHSAPAARAVGDALPLLRRASGVRIVTATDEASAAQKASGEALERHLAEHRIGAGFETVAIDGRPDGKVFEEFVEDNGIDLLVMGGYRHSRLNELIWGGVTATVINRPPCWVMLSH